MKSWTTMEWMKKLTIVLLIFLLVYLMIQLLPAIFDVLEFIIHLITPFLIALLIAYLLHPMVEGLTHQHIPRPLAIAIIYVLFFGLLSYALLKGMPYVIEQLKSFVKQIPELTRHYKMFINDFYYATSDLPETVHDYFDKVVTAIENWLKTLIEQLGSWVKGLITSIFTILLIPFLVFYFLKDWGKMKSGMYHIIPRKWRMSVSAVVHDIDESLGNFIRGQLLVCSVLAVIAFFGLWIIGVPYPLLLSLFIGITDIIPFFGPLLGAIPVILIALTISIKTVLFVAGFIIVLQFLEGNVISPLIVGKSVHVHPVFIILSLVVGEQLGGLVGLLLAVPTFIVLRVLVQHILNYYKKMSV